MKSKTLLVAFILSLPFWWGMNVFGEKTEDFLYWHQVSCDQHLILASVSQAIPKKHPEPVFEELNLKARSVISVRVNARGSKVLFEKNSKEAFPIASITKLMTALVAFETYDAGQEIAISETAVNQEGSSKYGDLKTGERLTVESLLYTMLIESSNDAAYAITKPIGEEAFVDLMNLYAQKLGLLNTHFANPSGLEPDDPKDPLNYSTAEDLVKLTKYILNNRPEIFEITKSNSYEVLKPNGVIHHFIPENTNKLLVEYGGIIGGKTGWGPAARGCLLLVIDGENDSYFINIVLGSFDRFSEMREIIRHINNI